MQKPLIVSWHRYTIHPTWTLRCDIFQRFAKVCEVLVQKITFRKRPFEARPYKRLGGLIPSMSWPALSTSWTGLVDCKCSEYFCNNKKMSKKNVRLVIYAKQKGSSRFPIYIILHVAPIVILFSAHRHHGFIWFDIYLFSHCSQSVSVRYFSICSRRGRRSFWITAHTMWLSTW